MMEERGSRNQPKRPIHVKMEASGPIFTAYVNGEKVSKFSDPSYKADKTKKVGLAIEYFDTVQKRVTFDNFEVKGNQAGT